MTTRGELYAIETEGVRERMRMLRIGVQQAIAQAFRQAVNIAESNAKSTSLFEDKTGETRKSIKGTAFGASGKVIAGGAARWLNFGTRPHVIRAKNASVLTWVANGSRHFAREVHHPGTAERPFMDQARDAGEHALLYALDLFISHALSRG